MNWIDFDIYSYLLNEDQIKFWSWSWGPIFEAVSIWIATDFSFISLNSEWEKNRMVLSLIKQKKTIDPDISKKNFLIENLFLTIFFKKNIILKKYC